MIDLDLIQETGQVLVYSRPSLVYLFAIIALHFFVIVTVPFLARRPAPDATDFGPEEPSRYWLGFFPVLSALVCFAFWLADAFGDLEHLVLASLTSLILVAVIAPMALCGLLDRRLIEKIRTDPPFVPALEAENQHSRSEPGSDPAEERLIEEARVRRRDVLQSRRLARPKLGFALFLAVITGASVLSGALPDFEIKETRHTVAAGQEITDGRDAIRTALKSTYSVNVMRFAKCTGFDASSTDPAEVEQAHRCLEEQILRAAKNDPFDAPLVDIVTESGLVTQYRLAYDNSTGQPTLLASSSRADDAGPAPVPEQLLRPKN